MELIQADKIQTKIFTVRGIQVMLDKDLASFYKEQGVAAVSGVIKRAV